MKKNDFNKTKEMDLKELESLVGAKKLELIKNQAKISGSAKQNLKSNWSLRREIAKLLTIIREKKQK